MCNVNVYNHSTLLETDTIHKINIIIEPFLNVVEAFQLKDFQVPLLNTTTQKKCPSLPKKAGKTNRKYMQSKSLVIVTAKPDCGCDQAMDWNPPTPPPHHTNF